MVNELWADAGYMAVQRVLGDFQAGFPIIVTAGEARHLAISIEALTPPRLDDLRRLAGGKAMLTLSATKAGMARGGHGAAVLPLGDAQDCERLVQVASGADGDVAARALPGGAALGAIIELAKLCHLLPAAVTVPLTPELAGYFPAALSVDAAEVRGFRAALARSLRLVSRAKVALRWDIESEFVVFREALGHNWTAVVIGTPDISQPVAVRLHSSCLTGDSFGSLRCDCGDQLRMSIELLRQDGGVLLYLDQEGCGIGLANKMRAYALQDTGLDTIDANMALGFHSDERHYGIAGRMLELLGIRQVRILTNNPSKVSGLSETGIEIVDRIPLIAPVNRTNFRYLDAKARRAGHLLEGSHVCATHAP